MARARLSQPPVPTYLDLGVPRRFQRALRNPEMLGQLWSEARTDADKSAQAIDEDVAELVRLLSGVDPLRVLGSLHMFDAIRRDGLPGEANFGSDAMLDLLATAACAEEEVAVLERIDHPFDLRSIWTIEQVLRRVANHLATIELGRTLAAREEGASSPVLSMLRLEHALDRMAGFDAHVRRVVTTVFAKVDDRARARLGFALSDSLVFASLYAQVRSIHADRAADAVADFPTPRQHMSRDQQVQVGAAHMTMYALHSSAPLEGGELDVELGRQLGLDEDQFAALVASMSTGLGSVEPDAVLKDTSIRTKPLLRLSSGEWMWPRPVDFIHGAMEWALGVCSTDQSLLRAFDAARQTVAEELAADLLAEVFGDEVTHRNVTYPDVQSDAENDAIVALPGLVLLVEAKGGRFSAAGRRGAPLRVDKHAKELVEAAAGQNARTANAITDGKTLIDSGGKVVPAQTDDEVLPVVVTLDRVDPFSTYLGQPRGGAEDEDDRNWVLNLADLVMIADILGTPEEFTPYARRRHEMARTGVRVFVEADCLGHWCEDRLATMQSVEDNTGRQMRMVGETSEAMNQYFTQQAFAHYAPDRRDPSTPVAKPGSGIPAAVLAALKEQRTQQSPGWPALVDAIGQVAPAQWKPFERVLETLTRRGTRPPNRRLQRSLDRARAGWDFGDQASVTLSSLEPLELTISTRPASR